MISKDNSLVKKGNLLIMSKLNLSVYESRILEIVFSQINAFDDIEFKKEYRVDVNDLYSINNNPNIYKQLESISKALSSKYIELRQKNGDFEFMSITNNVKYIKNEGAIFVELNDNLLEYLIAPKKKIEIDKSKIPGESKTKGWAFTSYRLDYHIKLQSNHSKRLYELFKQFETIGSRTMTITDIKAILGLESKYKLYSDFKRNVLISSQKELKKKTDIYFDFEEIKIRRSVYKLRFRIHKNDNFNSTVNKPINIQKNINIDAIDVESVEIINPNINEHNKLILELQKLKRDDEAVLNNKVAIDLIDKYGEHYIKNYIKLLKEEDKSSKKSFVGYVIKAIENDWLKGKKSVTIKTKNLATSKSKIVTDAQKRKMRDEFNAQYSKYYSSVTEKIFNSIDLQSEKLEYLSLKSSNEHVSIITHEIFSENRRSAEWVEFQNWIINKHPEFEILSIEAYAKKMNFKYL